MFLVHRARPRVGMSRSRATFVLAPLAVLALVVGLLPAVTSAAVADVGVPIYSAGTPIIVSGNLTVTGDLAAPDLPDWDIHDVFPPGAIRFTDQPTVGHAHLFTRTSGAVAMTDAQYTGMTAMEDDANATVRAYHGMSDTANNHDLVVKNARAELLAALYARIQRALASDHRTADEQNALTWIVALEQVRAVNAATAALAEFTKWDDAPCTYVPPAPFTDYHPEDDDYCRPSTGGPNLSFPDVPTNGQFVAWGSGTANPVTGHAAGLIGTAGTAAVAWGAGAGAFAAASAAGVAATSLASGLSAAIHPALYSLNIAARAPQIIAAASQAYSALGAAGGASVEQAASVGVQTLSKLPQFLQILPALEFAGVALIIVSTIVTLVLKGIDVFADDQVERDLNQALTNARAAGPDLRELMAGPDGASGVFQDLASSVVDCDPAPNSNGLVVLSGACNFYPDLPPRLVTDPIFQLQTLSDADAPPILESVAMTVGSGGSATQTHVRVRDGWLVVDGIPTPLTELPYTDWKGVNRVLKTVVVNGTRYWQSSRNLTNTGDDTGTIQDPNVRCAVAYTPDAPCFIAPMFPITNADGLFVVQQLDNRPPFVPALGTGTAVVATPFDLSTLLPAANRLPASGVAADGTNDLWSVESDDGCVKVVPSDGGPRGCTDRKTVRDGPHGFAVVAQPDHGSTVVWNAPGTYGVTVTRTDRYGVSTSVGSTVTVGPAPQILQATCVAPCIGGKGSTLTVTGRITQGAHADNELLRIDWGDGTDISGILAPVTTANAPVPPGPGLTASYVSAVERSFTATHTSLYDVPGAVVTVTVSDRGDGNPPPVTFTPSTRPVLDQATYSGNVSADTVGTSSPADFVVPVFTTGSGARITSVCTVPDPSTVDPNRTRTVGPNAQFSQFPVGTSVVTCSATDPANSLAGSVQFSITVHAITVTLVPVDTTVKAGSPARFTTTGLTDDGRTVAVPIDDDSFRVQADSPDTTCTGLSCVRTSSSGEIVAHPTYGNVRVGPDVHVYTVPNLPATVVRLGGDGQTGPIGGTLPYPLAVEVDDAFGNAVGGAPVTFTVTEGAASVGPGHATSVTVVTGAGGRIERQPLVLGTTPGPVTVTATSGDAAVATWHVTAAHARVEGISGSGAKAYVNGPAEEFAVQVNDENGAPVGAGVPVLFYVYQGPASYGGLTNVTVPTDAAGIARVTPTIGDTPGLVVANASVGSAQLSITVDVLPNSAPVTSPRTFTVTAGAGPLTSAAPGVLTGATDADGDPVTAALTTGPQHGRLTLAADGSFSYTPFAGYVGGDSFTYRASDGIVSSAPTTVTLDVLAANADLGVTITAPSKTRPGRTLEVVVTMTNNGPSTAKPATLSLTLPVGFTVVSTATPARVNSTERIALVTVAALAAGQSRTLTLTVVSAATVGLGGRPLVAAVSSSTADPVGANNSVRRTVKVT